MNNITNLFPLISGFLVLGLGILVFYKNNKSRVNALFFAHALVISLWLLGTYMLFSSKTTEQAVFWDRLIYLPVVFIPAFMYHFGLAYRKAKPDLLLKVAYFLSVFFFLTSQSRYFVDDAFFYTWGVHTKAKILHHLFLVYFVSYVVIWFYQIGVFYKQTLEILSKHQLRIVIIAFLLLFGIGPLAYLPAYGIGIYPFAYVSGLIFTIVLSYAILRYRFLDIRFVIRRSVIFSAIVIIIASIFSGFTLLFSTYVQSFIGKSSTLVSGAITGILVAIGFEPIKNVLTRVTDKFLFKGTYNQDELLAQLSNDFSSSLNLKTILKTSTSRIVSAFRIASASVYLLDKTTNTFVERYQEGDDTGTITLSKSEIEKYLKTLRSFGLQNEVLVTEELRRQDNANTDENLKTLISRLDKFEVAVTAPLYVKNELIGFYFLGNKKSGDLYSTQDIHVLDIITGQAAVAIENAALYEEQRKFGEKLQMEVDRATSELRSANKELKKLDQAKSEFISIASHQLRTPMTVIKGYMSMVKNGDFGVVDAKLNKPIDSVFASANRLLVLIEDLLNVSRIESGRMQYEFSKANIKDLVTSVFDELSQNAKKKGLDFTLKVSDKQIPDIIMDANKIREVIINLTDNAIKYTDKGKVEVSLDVDGNEIRYSVKDSGRGMSKEDIGKLFKKFSRVGSAQLVHTEGTGLGLYIAKQIIMKHKGKIWAESEGEKKGSVFSLALKIENPVTQTLFEKQEKAKQDETKKKDMYVEDTIDMSRVRGKGGS